MVTSQLDFDAKYRVSGYGGIAFYLIGYKKERDGNYWWTGIEIEDRSMVQAVMVGDDTVHLIYIDDLEKISDEDYCPECGQIGCKAYG